MHICSKLLSDSETAVDISGLWSRAGQSEWTEGISEGNLQIEITVVGGRAQIDRQSDSNKYLQLIECFFSKSLLVHPSLKLIVESIVSIPERRD